VAQALTRASDDDAEQALSRCVLKKVRTIFVPTPLREFHYPFVFIE
jgi:hypothetical protein